MTEPSTSKKHKFMDKYSTEKTEEQLAYEQSTQQLTMYYDINGVKYEVPPLFANTYLDQIKSGNFDFGLPLKTNDGINYIIDVQKMAPEDKYSMLKRMTDLSLNQISQETAIIAEFNPNTELKDTFPQLCRKASFIDHISNKLYSEGNVNEANDKLENMLGKILKLYEDMSKDEPQNTR